jgi:hypothetical protein
VPGARPVSGLGFPGWGGVGVGWLPNWLPSAVNGGERWRTYRLVGGACGERQRSVVN